MLRTISSNNKVADKSTQVALDMTIVTTAIPKITDQFRSLEQVGWYGSAFFLTLACFQSFWGKLYTASEESILHLHCNLRDRQCSMWCVTSLIIAYVCRGYH
jgi:MFS family permease